MKPTIGRIVHYVLGEGDGVHEHKVGRHVAAMVVNVWGPGCVNLLLFLDGSNDAQQAIFHPDHPEGKKIIPRFMAWATSRMQDEDRKQPGSWHWPEREESAGIQGQPGSVVFSHGGISLGGPVFIERASSEGEKEYVFQSGASADREEGRNSGEERGSDPGSGSAEGITGGKEEEPQADEGQGSK